MKLDQQLPGARDRMPASAAASTNVKQTSAVATLVGDQQQQAKQLALHLNSVCPHAHPYAYPGCSHCISTRQPCITCTLQPPTHLLLAPSCRCPEALLPPLGQSRSAGLCVTAQCYCLSPAFAQQATQQMLSELGKLACQHVRVPRSCHISTRAVKERRSVRNCLMLLLVSCVWQGATGCMMHGQRCWVRHVCTSQVISQ
jgi:hypothetical protein